ncbi:MAG TPA: DUF11 domain-containing protein, partial [Thermoplasmatales archaeon]|nr:DUF11 domain-containing protein [Thermoplasmatales archaeon]
MERHFKGMTEEEHSMYRMLPVFFTVMVLVISSSFYLFPSVFAQSSLNMEIIVPEEVNVCEPDNYTLHINNRGDESAFNITVQVTMPADFHYINGSANITFPNGTSTADPLITGQNLSWNLTPLINPLGVNESIQINFSLVAYCNASSGCRIEATVYYDNKSTSAFSSSMLVNRGLIFLEKLPQQQNAAVGDVANWTVRITNIGTGPLFNVTVRDTLGSGLVLNSTNATTWPNWSYSRIDVDETMVVYVAAEVVSCEGLYNTVNASWGCTSICQETFAQGTIKLIARPPDISYSVEPNPINLPYCGNRTIWINVTNTGTGPANNMRFVIKGMPSEYSITNVTGGTYYESNTTLYVETVPANSSKNISFEFGPQPALMCSAPSSGTLVFDPKYEDQCGHPWAAPPVAFVPFSREGGSSLSVNKIGPNLLYVGENGTYTLSVTYNQGGCAYPNITTNITDTFPAGFVVIDNGTGNVSGNTIVWHNITLENGVPWSVNVTFRNEGPCGMLVTNTLSVEEVEDCCGCSFSGSASVDTASVCPENYTFVQDVGWNKTASPAFTENSHNITYYNNITFHITGINWSDIWFREQENNGQTFWPYGTMSSNATFIINGSIVVNHSITLEEWNNLSFLNNYTSLANGTTLSIVYSLHQWSTGTFVDWSDLNISGHPNPDSPDGMYHSGVWVTVGRADYSIGIDIPSIVSDCGIYNVSITLNNNSNWDCYDMVITLNCTNYGYMNNSTFFTGIQYYNESLGSYMNVPTFEPEQTGNLYVWNFSKNGYWRIHTGGSISLSIIKRCQTPGPVSATLAYKDNCGFSYTENASDQPILVTSGNLIIIKTPEETFAYSRQLNWRIYVINKGNGNAFNAAVTDMLPHNLSYISSTIDGVADHANTTIDGQNITWNLGDMLPSEVKIIELFANLTGCEYVNNYAEAHWGCIYGEICQQINASSIVRLIGDRIIVIRHDIGLIDLCGDEAMGTIVLKNGQVDTYAVNVTEYLPENLTYVPDSWNVTGATPSSVTTWGNNISWHFDSISRGATVTITFNVTISSPCAEISEYATAKVNYTLPCTAYGSEDIKEFMPQKASPHLSIAKEPAHTIAEPGDTINWTITIISNGDYEAKNVTLYDILPDNVAYVSSSPSADSGNGSVSNPLTWNLSNMSVGSNISINISVTVSGCTVNDTINNATVTWGCCPLTLESNTDVVYLRTSPDISLSQSHEDIIPCGGNFTITIHNNGSIANVSSIWFEIPFGYVYNTGSAVIESSNTSRTFANTEPADYSSINLTVMWNRTHIDYIYPNETVTIYFEIVDNGTGCADDISSYANTTFIFRNLCNHTFTTDTSQYVDPLHPILSVSKLPPTQVMYASGETATWTIRVSNTGDTDARNVSIVDILGTAFDNTTIITTYQNGTPDTSSHIANNVITWLNQTIPMGTNTWIRIIYANVTATGSTNNTVIVNGTCASGCIYSSATVTTFAARHNISKTPNSTRTIGEYANFTINVSFWGVGEIYRNTTVEDTLPAGLLYVNSTIDGAWDPGNTSINGQTVSWYLGNFTGPRNVTVNITTIVEDVISNQNGTTLADTASVTHEDEFGNSFSSQDVASVLILEPDLSITKSANQSIVEAGDIVNYSIVVTHTSASAWTAYDVWINDTIPDGLTFVSAASSPVATS